MLKKKFKKIQKFTKKKQREPKRTKKNQSVLIGTKVLKVPKFPKSTKKK